MMLPGFDERSYNKNDVVLTPPQIAGDIVKHFQPTGKILDPCKGDGAFTEHMPGAAWCEIREGVDFFAWGDRVDWIVSNPPYSIFTEWLDRSLKIADDIVYLIPLSKVFNSEARLRDIMRWGGIVETRHYGSGTDCGFPFGFPCGAVHIRRGYKGPMRWSFYCQNARAESPNEARNERNAG